MDGKTSDETKELYRQDLDKLKLEEEVFYEYFSAITFFQGMISKTWMGYDQFIVTQSENFFKLYSIGDKLDILTDFNSFNIDETCFTCPHTYRVNA